MSDGITALTVPKWGLSMDEGRVAAWHVDEGEAVEKGQEVVDIETEKINNACEAPAAGILRRRLAQEGDTLPVGALLGVIAPAEVGDDDIDRFIEDFRERAESMEAASGGEADPEPQVAATDAGGLRYLKMGEGDDTPVLLIHGFGGDLNSWLFLQPVLAQHRPTYALDLPGHGGSTKDIAQADVPALARAVAAFADAVGLERAHVVGHSLGAAVAMDLARGGPMDVESLTLIAPAGLGREINMDYIRGFIQASRRKELKPVLQMLFADPDLVSRDMVQDVLKYKRLDGVDAALQQLADAVFAGDAQAPNYRDSLAAWERPAQVIWGEADRVIPAEHAQGLPDDVVVHVLDESGHMAHMEKAHEVADLISAFLRAQ